MGRCLGFNKNLRRCRRPVLAGALCGTHQYQVLHECPVCFEQKRRLQTLNQCVHQMCARCRFKVLRCPLCRTPDVDAEWLATYNLLSSITDLLANRLPSHVCVMLHTEWAPISDFIHRSLEKFEFRRTVMFLRFHFFHGGVMVSLPPTGRMVVMDLTGTRGGF